MSTPETTAPEVAAQGTAADDLYGPLDLSDAENGDGCTREGHSGPDRERLLGCEPSWFLGAPPFSAPPEPGTPEARIEREQLRVNPLMVRAGLLVEFIGDGRRLKRDGGLFQVEEKAFEDFTTRSVTASSPERPTMAVVANLLIRSGHLVVHGGDLVPTRPLIIADFDPASDAFVGTGRRLLALALGATRVPGATTRITGAREPDVVVDDDVLDALLVASGPGGLHLPDTPRSPTFQHVERVQEIIEELRLFQQILGVSGSFPRGWDLPFEIARLGALATRLDKLHGWGLTAGDHHHLRAPIAVRSAVREVRESRGRSLRCVVLDRYDDPPWW